MWHLEAEQGVDERVGDEVLGEGQWEFHQGLGRNNGNHVTQRTTTHDTPRP